MFHLPKTSGFLRAFPWDGRFNPQGNHCTTPPPWIHAALNWPAWGHVFRNSLKATLLETTPANTSHHILCHLPMFFKYSRTEIKFTLFHFLLKCQLLMSRAFHFRILNTWTISDHFLLKPTELCKWRRLKRNRIVMRRLSCLYVCPREGFDEDHGPARYVLWASTLILPWSLPSAHLHLFCFRIPEALAAVLAQPKPLSWCVGLRSKKIASRGITSVFSCHSPSASTSAGNFHAVSKLHWLRVDSILFFMLYVADYICKA